MACVYINKARGNLDRLIEAKLKDKLDKEIKPYIVSEVAKAKK